MSIRITCEFCEAKLCIRPDKLGQRLKCPSCRNVISAETTSVTTENMESTLDQNPSTVSLNDDAEGFDFAAEFGLEGLLPESDLPSEDLPRMPPARKPASRTRKNGPKTATSETKVSCAKSPNHCSVCRKQLDRGVRYCSGCGHNNFDADAAAVDAQLRIQTRMEQLTASLGIARILRIFSRMFR